MQIVISIVVAVILVSSSVFAYLIYFGNNGEEDKDEKKEIDDNISPDTNQAIWLWIHRIRKKGIIDKMYNSGFIDVDKLRRQSDDSSTT